MATNTASSERNLNPDSKFWQPLLVNIPTDTDHRAVLATFLGSDPYLREIALQTPGSLYHWINDSESKISIELVRRLKKQLSYSYAAHEPQFYVIHRLENGSTASQNALLKILEEPPPNTQLVITTQQPELILPTIHSRCIFLTLSQNDSADNLQAGTDFFIQIEHAKNFGELIQIAEKIGDREVAISTLQQMVHYMYHEKIRSNSQNRLGLIQFAEHINTKDCH